jgi:hypothetical protein
MGRPRKNPDQVDETGPEGSAEEPGSQAPTVKVEEAPLPEARDCPVCGSKAKTGLDNHGLYRTHCADERCRFGDAYARETERESVEIWNVIGPPSASND